MRTRRTRRGTPKGVAVLLGPQSEQPTVARVLRDLESAGHVKQDARVGVISAGWREREGESEFLDPSITSRTVDLGLYRRAERVARADPELAREHKALQNRLKLLRRAYNIRLDRLTEAHHGVRGLRGEESILAAEREDALDALRALDQRHLERITELRAEFDQAHRPGERAAVQVERSEIDAELDDVGVVLVAGGHIATLLNRLRLFGGRSLFEGRPAVGWSAGAMALGPRVALFHDRPPWGAGNPEAFDNGLGIVDAVVPLPNASVRLALDDRVRTGRLAARFAPAACVLLDPGSRIDWIDGVWKGYEAVRRIDRAGRQIRFRPAA